MNNYALKGMWEVLVWHSIWEDFDIEPTSEAVSAIFDGIELGPINETYCVALYPNRVCRLLVQRDGKIIHTVKAIRGK